jgi:CAAX prenyl protease-like protein
VTPTAPGTTTSPPRLGMVAAVTGVLLLAARPALVRATPQPTAVLVVLFGAVLVAGWCWPAPPRRQVTATVTVLALGFGAFCAGRVIGGGHPPAALSLHLIVLNSFAAVAEEAFFRRLWYGLLLPGGPVLAVIGSTVLFGAVHVATYGAGVLPLDLAAGLVLGWQRWASDDWRVPALTHVVANILVVI